MRGALKFVDDDLPKAFASVDDLHLLGDLADAQTEASQAIGAYIQYLETDLAPRARSSFRLGREKFEQKLKLDEGITLSLDRLLAIATRELHATQEEFRSVAGRMNGGDPLEAWAHAPRPIHRSQASWSTSRAGARRAGNLSRTPEHLRCRRARRSRSRRRRIFTGGHLPACGRQGPSRQKRPVRITT
jgi:hypothetical protein